MTNRPWGFPTLNAVLVATNEDGVLNVPQINNSRQTLLGGNNSVATQVNASFVLSDNANVTGNFTGGIGGTGNTLQADLSGTISGKGLTLNYGTVGVGQFNLISGGSALTSNDVLFLIGNGVDNTHRSNALAVRRDGSAYFGLTPVINTNGQVIPTSINGDGNTAHYLNGAGTYTTPAGGAGVTSSGRVAATGQTTVIADAHVAVGSVIVCSIQDSTGAGTNQYSYIEHDRSVGVGFQITASSPLPAGSYINYILI